MSVESNIATRAPDLALPIMDEFPKVKFCMGHAKIGDNGENHPCCLFCYLIKIAIGLEMCTIHHAPLHKWYIGELKKQYPDLHPRCTLTTCTGKPYVLVHKCFSEVSTRIIIESILIQAKFRNRLMLVDKNFSDLPIAYTANSTPILMVGENTEKRQAYGGDEGIDFKDNLFTVTNRDEVYKSGKWMYLLNYYDFVNGMLRDKLPLKPF